MSFAISSIVRSTLILFSAMVLHLVLRQASASTRHVCWTLAVAASLAVPIIATVAPAMNLPLLSSSMDSVTPNVPLRAPVFASWPAIALTADSSAEATNSGKAARAISHALPVPWIWIVWMMGAVTVFSRSLLAFRDVRHLLRHSAPADDRNWHRILLEVSREFYAYAPLQLRISHDAVPPMTWGILRRTILLPSIARIWTEEQLRLVLAHEMAHIERRESWIQVLVQVAMTVYWFNPLVWYAAYRMRIEREQACDDRVLQMGANAEDYADHLLAIARVVTLGSTTTAISMVHPSNLELRLTAILDRSLNRRKASWSGTIAMIASAAALSVLAATAQLTALPLAPTISVMLSAAPEPIHSIPFLMSATTQRTPKPPDVVLVCIDNRSG